MMFSLAKRSKQQGISLLEVMLSLAIIAVILVMATRYYKVAQQSQQVSNALSLIGGIISAETQYAVANNNAYTADMNALKSGGYLPSNFGNNPWGAPILLTPQGSTIVIRFDNVPPGPCAVLQKTLDNSLCNGSTFTVPVQ